MLLAEDAGTLPPLFILGGPCLDYLGAALRVRRPGARILAVQYSDAFRDLGEEPPEATHLPGNPESIEAFLLRHLDDDRLERPVLVEWPPAVREFPAEAERLRQGLRFVLDRLAAGAATVRATGRRWIMNSLRQFLLVRTLVEAEPWEGTSLIAGAGPSLEEDLDAIGEHRARLRLIVVSSALRSLLARGLVPDLVVATDGGFWSRFHLLPLAARPLALASPLSALPSASLAPELLLLDQGGFPEGALCAALGGGLPLPPHGTVTGSALALAATLGEGPLVVAGFDFAAPPSRGHARPHGFDEIILAGEGRLRSAEGLRHARYATAHDERLPGTDWRSSRSLSTYAAALDADARSLGRPVYRLGPSPLPLPSFTDLDTPGLGALVGRSALPPLALRRRQAPPMEERRALLASLFASWRQGIGEALDELAKGGRPEAGMADLLRCIDLVDLAAALRNPGPGGRASREGLGRAARSFIDEAEGRLLT